MLVTALGVGANTAAFSVADFVLVRPLPFPDPESLVRLCEGPRTGGGWGCMNQLSPANYRDFQPHEHIVRGAGRVPTAMPSTWSGSGEPLRVPSARVTREMYCRCSACRPLIGRVFETQRRRHGRRSRRARLRPVAVAVRRRPGVLGGRVHLDGAPYVVIGVMPPTFFFPDEDVQCGRRCVLREDDFARSQ